MLVRKDHLLLRLLNVRAIVNGIDIYELKVAQPLVIPCTSTTISLVISNGFQLSRIVELKYEPGATFLYQVECEIDNYRLFYAIFLSLFLFVVYVLTDMRALMIIANIPILYLLYVFYVGRKNFIAVTPLGKV